MMLSSLDRDFFSLDVDIMANASQEWKLRSRLLRMNITVLYDPRGARALFSMKYHYIPLLAILSQLYDYNLEIAAYPAQKFGYSHPPDESYVQNCVSLVEPNKTEKLEILNCLTHCEFCRDLGLCHHSKSMYTPACIKQVKGDLKLLLKCEMNKRRVISMVYHSWYVHWKKFRSHGNSANPVVLLIDGAQEALRIMDTGLLDVICHHLKSTDNENFNQLCGEFNRRDTIQRMIEESPGSHLIVSGSNTLKWHSALDRLPLLLMTLIYHQLAIPIHLISN